ncbi:MAG: N-ATPase subunit AtpR [Gammaproteobacteria bacterium]
MMSDYWLLLTAFAAGVVLGALFFGGLWWTVRKGLASARPGLWFFGSLLVRSTAVAAGFYIVGGGQWQRLIACLLGFLAVRRGVVKRMRAALAAGMKE